jgi:hypothetical protein
MNLDKLTQENIEAQFCSDWLKSEIRSLFKELARVTHDMEMLNMGCNAVMIERDAALAKLKIVEEELSDNPPMFIKTGDHHYQNAATKVQMALDALHNIREHNPIKSLMKGTE